MGKKKVISPTCGVLLHSAVSKQGGEKTWTLYQDPSEIITNKKTVNVILKQCLNKKVEGF